MRIDISDDSDRSIDLAPLIDCIFLLLVFFMLTTTFEKNRGGAGRIELELPRMSSATSIGLLDSLPPFQVAIDRDGTLYIDSTQSSLTRLHDILREDIQLYPQRSIEIFSDKNIAFGKVAQVLNLCHFLGRKSISIKAEAIGERDSQ